MLKKNSKKIGEVRFMASGTFFLLATVMLIGCVTYVTTIYPQIPVVILVFLGGLSILGIFFLVGKISGLGM